MKRTIITLLTVLMLVSCQKTANLVDKPTITNSAGTEIVTYGIVTSKTTTIDATHSRTVVQKSGKILEVISVKTSIGTRFQSTGGLVYYDVLESGDVYEYNRVPFEQIGITPIGSFYTCMRDAVRVCKSSRFCVGVYFTNLFGIASFSFGMTLKCALGY